MHIPDTQTYVVIFEPEESGGHPSPSSPGKSASIIVMSLWCHPRAKCSVASSKMLPLPLVDGERVCASICAHDEAILVAIDCLEWRICFLLFLFTAPCILGRNRGRYPRESVSCLSVTPITVSVWFNGVWVGSKVARWKLRERSSVPPHGRLYCLWHRNTGRIENSLHSQWQKIEWSRFARANVIGRNSAETIETLPRHSIVFWNDTRIIWMRMIF